MVHMTKAGHNHRQFDKSTMNLAIDIVSCRLSSGPSSGIVGLSLKDKVLLPTNRIIGKNILRQCRMIDLKKVFLVDIVDSSVKTIHR